jgi:DNA-binding LacI/PurR family transcriptional regulator
MPTRKDVATLAGVSPASVSYYINKSGYVSREKTERIQKAIDELNYRPNRIARSLKTKKTYQIVLISNEIRNPFNAELVYETTTLMYERGYTILFSNVVDDPAYADTIIGYQADGVIIVSDRFGPDKIRQIRKKNIPVVLLTNMNWDPIGDGVAQIRLDVHAAVRAAVRHIVELGHKRIGWVGSCKGPDCAQMDGKTKGFMDEMAASGLTVADKDLFFGIASARRAYEAMAPVLRKGDYPSAFVCVNDAVGIGIIGAARDNGLHVPRDVAVSGFADMEYSRLCDPPLTTVDIGMKELSRTAVDMMLRMVDGEEVADESTSWKLIVRGSTG